MSNDFNWDDLANTKAKDVTPPPLLPPGHYIAQFTGLWKQHTAARSGNKAFQFPFKLVGPGEDVDAKALEEMGGIPDKTYPLNFWMSPDARWRFTSFTGAMGISDDLNLIEQANALFENGDPFMIEAKQEPVQENGVPVDPPRFRTVFDNPTAAS